MLDTNKTIKDQEKARLEKAIQLVRVIHLVGFVLTANQIQKTAVYFERFQGGWPIRNFIKQYLANNQDKYKRALREERAAEATDTDDWSATAQGGEDETELEVGDDGDSSDEQDYDADVAGDDAEFEGDVGAGEISDGAGSDPGDELMDVDEVEEKVSFPLAP